MSCGSFHGCSARWDDSGAELPSCRMKGQKWQSGEGCMPEPLGLSCCLQGPWQEQGCFPQLLLESQCSQCTGLDFVEVGTILEKAFTCHMHENLTGFSSSPA